MSKSGSRAPPPPPLDGGGESSCTTLTESDADWPLALDVHVRVKVRVSDPPVMTGLGSVIVALPLVGRLLFGHPSFEPPPELTHVEEFAEDQVSVVDWPVCRVVGEAVRVNVTEAQLTAIGAV
jgi:hypothetical protein